MSRLIGPRTQLLIEMLTSGDIGKHFSISAVQFYQFASNDVDEPMEARQVTACASIALLSALLFMLNNIAQEGHNREKLRSWMIRSITSGVIEPPGEDA